MHEWLLTPREVKAIINNSYDDDPWVCAEDAVDEAIKAQAKKLVEWLAQRQMHQVPLNTLMEYAVFREEDWQALRKEVLEN